MEGVKRVQPPGQAQGFDEALGRLDFVVLVLILDEDLAQDDLLLAGEGAQHLRRPGVFKTVEAAAQALPSKAMTGAASARVAAWARNCTAIASGSSPCKV